VGGGFCLRGQCPEEDIMQVYPELDEQLTKFILSQPRPRSCASTAQRDVLTRWTERRTPEELVVYRAEHNTASIDGLPALG
jgi:hypothetical protein